MPAPADNYAQWTWEQGLQYLLNGGRDHQDVIANRELVAGSTVTWIEFVSSEEIRVKRPDSYMYAAGPNEVVAWQNIPASGKYRFVRGKITFFDRIGDGPSPFSNFMTFQYAGDIARDTLNAGGNAIFYPQSFRDASVVLSQVASWLDRSNGELKALYDSINRESSGFNGSAANAFAVVLKNLQNGVRQLHLDVAGPGETSWAERVNGKAGDMEEFRVAVTNAWNAYQANVAYADNTYNPGHLIDVIRGIVRGAYHGTLNNVAISFGEAGGGNYDLTVPGGWQQLNAQVKNAWLHQVGNLDSALRQAVSVMSAKFRDTQRNINQFGEPPREPPPTRSGPGSDNGSGGAGGDGRLGLDLNLGGADLDLGSGGGGGSGLGLGGGGGAGLGGAGGDLGLGGADGLGGAGDLDLGDLDLGGVGGAGGVGPGGLIGGLGPGLPRAGLPTGGAGGGGSGRRTAIGGSDLTEDDTPGGADSARFPTAIDPVQVGGGSGSGLGRLESRGGAAIGALGPVAGGGGTGASVGVAALGAPGGEALDVGGVLEPTATLGGVPGSTAAIGGRADGSLGQVGAGPGGYPFIPPMGGMGGPGATGGGDRDRERNTWLEEDEEVWGTDPECAPAVIGRGDLPDQWAGNHPTDQPSSHRRSGSVDSPTRTTQTARR